MKRKNFLTLFGGVALSAMLALSAGCSLTPEAVGITSIQKTDSNGLVDTYTVYYSDGTTDTFQITNGKDGADGVNGTDGVNGADGEDGKDVTALELYETYKSIYGEELTYAEFLSLYLSFDGDTEEADESKVVSACLRSVGKIYCEFTEPNTSTIYNPNDVTQAIYTGGCVIYKMDGEYTYFVTNYHVVYSENAVSEKLATTAYCYLYGSESKPVERTDGEGHTYIDYGAYGIECEYIGGAATYDIAVLRAKTQDVKAIGKDAQAVTLAQGYHVGETAIAVGNPNGEGLSVTKGIVSVDSEYISLSVDGTSREYRSLRVDTALYQGNSGGGLFNAQGQLIGLANAGNKTDQNVNYAIPVEIVKGAVDNVLLHYYDANESTFGVYKPTIGVTVTAANSKYVYDKTTGYGKIVEDILIVEVKEGGVVQGLGLQADDVITAIEIDGVAYGLDRYFEIGDYLLYATDGVELAFVYKRGGQEYKTETYTLSASELNSVA